VELFINGRVRQAEQRADGTKQERYRMMWNETKYEPGELKAVAYDKEGNIAATEVIKTAGKPDHLMLSADRTSLSADGEDLAYITVSMADKDGNVCPMDSSLVTFKVSGAGHFRASANGNPCSLDPFQNPKMHLFSGKLTAIVQSGYKKGGITFTASGKGVRSATLKLDVQ
jgi:beta-galactosidase